MITMDLTQAQAIVLKEALILYANDYAAQHSSENYVITQEIITILEGTKENVY